MKGTFRGLLNYYTMFSREFSAISFLIRVLPEEWDHPLRACRLICKLRMRTCMFICTGIRVNEDVRIHEDRLRLVNLAAKS